MKFQTALEGYWLEKKRDFSPSTISDYTNTFRRFVQCIGVNSHIEDVTSDHVRTYLNHLADQGRAPKTIANAWTALSSFYTWAERELNVKHVIRGAIKVPRVPPPEIIPYTQQEIMAMLHACDHTGGKQRQRRPTALRDRAMIVTLVDTGIRVSELAALTITDYNRRSGQILIREGKGRKPRTVYAGQNARRHLWRYLADRLDVEESAPLFATKRNTHMHRDNIRHTIQRLAKQCGIAGANVHRFRHTYAINFLRNGGNPLQLQRLLGHAKMQQVLTYVQLAEVDLEIAQRIASPGDHWRL